MDDPAKTISRPRSSRQRYRAFVEDYKLRRLDDAEDKKQPKASEPEPRSGVRGGKRKEYLREYVRWLWPHRIAVAGFLVLALLVAGLQMVEPLFMRFIIDRVLLNNTLDSPSRVTRLNAIGASFLALMILSNLANAFKDYRQRLVNIRVMLALRRTLFDRLLHL